LPAFRRYSPSVAPVPIVGTTMTPGHIALVIDSSGCITCGWSGDGWLGLASSTNDTVTFGSATRSASFCLIEAGASPGRMRQFTFADASCGRALVAWPPESIVATHVVRISAL